MIHKFAIIDDFFDEPDSIRKTIIDTHQRLLKENLELKEEIQRLKGGEMKLIQVANRGSGRQVVLQFTTSELISVIAMFEVVLGQDRDGYQKEKTMRAKFENVLRRIEELTRNNEDFYSPPTKDGRVFFDGEEEVEPTH